MAGTQVGIRLSRKLVSSDIGVDIFVGGKVAHAGYADRTYNRVSGTSTHNRIAMKYFLKYRIASDYSISIALIISQSVPRLD